MRRWHGVIGIVLTLGVLAFLVYRLDLPTLRHALAGAQYAYILPLLGTTFILYGVGALQWRLVLSPVQRVRPLRLFGAQMVGALAHGLLYLPVRGLVQAYVVARRERVSLSAVLATTVVDRLVDGFAFLGLVGVVLAFTDLPVGAAPGVDFSWGRAGIAARIRYACGIPRQRFHRRPFSDAMPYRYHTR